jgi:nucleotide-binding universal stress UspA family protein
MPVLVAIDGPWHADAPLRLGAQIAQRSGEPLTILTVVRPKAAGAQAQSDQILARARELDLPGASDMRIRVRIGDPATEIVREADEGGYDLVIVGERTNKNLLSRFLMGSTAIRVVEHAPCPVIVAKGRVGPIQRILLCDSGSEDPSVGLPAVAHNAHGHVSNASAATLPGTGGTGRAGPSLLSRFTKLPLEFLNGAGEIVVLHVMSQMSAGPGVQGKQLRSDTEVLMQEHAPEGDLLGRDIEALERLGFHARAKVCHGLVVEEILEEAQRGDHDLVVIGAYRGAGWQRILLDDLAHRIVVELDRSVLVLR